MTVLGLANPVWAETVVPAGDYDVATWTEAGSPYMVMGDVSFTELAAEAGTHVVVTYADPLITISVTTLTLNGTRDKPVTFEPESSEPAARWMGIFMVSNSAMATLSHARIRGANTGLEIWGGTATVMGSIFEGNTSRGLESDGGVRFEVDSTQFLGSGIGFLARLDDEVFVDNSLFVGNGTGLDCLGAITCRVRNSTFDDHDRGILTDDGLDVESSIFSNNGVAIQTPGSRVVQAAYSDFWQNAVDVRGELQGEGNLYEDPQYVAPGDYRLSPSSPCIDAAAANGPAHDLTGTPRPLDGDALPDDGGLGSDMGAYEYNPNPDSTGGSGGAGGAAGGASGEAGEGNEGATGGADAGDGGILGEDSGGGSDAGRGGPATDVAGAAMGGALPGDAGSAEGLMSGSGDAARSDPSLVSQSRSQGCGCRQASGQRSGRAWLLALMWIGLLAAERRRRT